MMILVDDPYSYTTIIHLSQIIDKNWGDFDEKFQFQKEKLFPNKKQLLQMLRKLNHLRNSVMHPVKGKTWRPEELNNLKMVYELLQFFNSELM